VTARAAIGYAALAALIAVGVYAYMTLPDSVPVRWSNSGAPVAWGSRATILILPALGAFSFVLITVLMAVKPRVHGLFAVSMEREDAAKAAVYDGMGDLRTLLSCGMLAMTIAIAASSSGALSPAFVPIVIGFVLAVLVLVASIVARAWRASYR
jgi:uncharacterized membrane protein